MAWAQNSSSIIEIESDAYSSPQALAQAFGSTILVPSWWPLGTAEIEYLLELSRSVSYRVGSVRHDGVPIVVIGCPEVAGARSPRDWLVGEWSEPEELTQVRGAIGRVGDPPRLHTVIYGQNLQLQLIGYETEDEIVRTVSGLRRIGPE
jgi:hypothetical protein